MSTVSDWASTMLKQLLVAGTFLCSPLPTALGFVPPGFEIVQITDDFNFYDSFADINNCGQIVFGKRMGASWAQSEILLYENGSTLQITENQDRDVIPAINDSGEIAWLRGLGTAGVHQVLRSKLGQSTVIVDSPTFVDSGVDINDSGCIVWSERTFEGCQSTFRSIRFFDGQSIHTIIGDGGAHHSPQLNNQSEVVWANYDFCVDPWDSIIMLASVAEPVEISTDQFEVQTPRINDAGHVVWGGPGGIQLWRPPGSFPEPQQAGYYGTIIEITPNGVNPSLNNQGDISFGRLREDTNTGQIWLHSNGYFYQITDDPAHSHWDSRINDWGEIVWQIGFYPQSDVMFMRRIRNGEADFNGFIDRNDHAALVSCLTGPVAADGLCDCRFLDIDHDRDVDLADFALFQQNFGWQAPPDLKHPPGTGEQL
jgi:hypothetical protein